MPHGLPHMGFLKWLRGLGYTIGAIVTVFLLGRVLHELTHVLVANAFGYEVTAVEWHPLRGRVTYEVPSDAPEWHARAINGAPQVIGTVVALCAAVWLLVADVNMVLLYILGVGWFAYTVMGSASDLSMAAARGTGHLWYPEQHEQLAVVALGLLIGGFLLGQASPDSAYLGPLRTEIMLGFAIAGIGVMAMSVLEYDKTRE